ncbi:tachykinin family protein [Rutstroemia sp. NJR-2017a BVV2]|nr:tachykinin family protein [Rutstroemia sp. NJR-2017a BVV2]
MSPSDSGQRGVNENNPSFIHEMVSRGKQVAIADSMNDHIHEEVTSRIASQPLRFINEQELWQPNNKDVRKAIRAHVRKDTHLKQERRKEVLNARYSSRPLLIKQSQDSQGTASKHTSSNYHTPPDLPSSGVIGTAGNSSYSSGEILRRQYKVQCELQARTWPFPQGVRSARPAVSVFMPLARIPVPNAQNGRPCLLKSSKVMPYLINCFDYFSFKDEVIRWINGRLGDPGESINDVTIGVVMCLINFELSRGNEVEIIHHMNGLEQIMNLRGGLQNLSLDNQFLWKIQVVDLLAAVMTSSEPRFPPISSTTPRNVPQSIDAENIQINSESPLYAIQNYKNFEPPFSDQTIAILQDMSILVAAILEEKAQPTELRGPKAHQIHALPNNQSSSLLMLIHLTSTIFHPALGSPPIPFTSTRNTQSVMKICEILEDISLDATFVRYPGILLWVLLTTASAAADRPERGYLVTFLLRIGTSAIWWGMEEFVSSVKMFMYLKKRAEGGG